MSKGIWTDEFLDAARHWGDDFADKTVAAVYTSGALDAVNQLLVTLTKHSAPPPGKLVDLANHYFATTPNPPPWARVVADYLTGTGVLPDWADRGKIALAESLFSRHGILATAILCCASLPECYLDRDGVPVLASTQNLENHVYRRIWETSHMVIGVMSPGGLDPDRGQGIRACQHVRLMHAAIRYLLQGPPHEAGEVGEVGHLGRMMAGQQWDEMRLGRPLNQEDQAYVLLTFSYVGLRGLETLGVPVTDEEREAYIHAWNVVGYLMGIRERMMPFSYDDAKFLFERIKARHRGASPDGTALATALVAWMTDAMPPGLKNLPKILIQELIGKEDAILLGVELAGFEVFEEQVVRRALGDVSRAVSDAYRDEPLTRRAAELLFHRLVQKVWKMDRQWDRELFAIPPELQQSWRVRVPPRAERAG